MESALDDAIQQVPRDQFPSEMPLEIGVMMAAQTPQGPLPFTVTEIADDVVTVDFNHQMAGKTLKFSVEVVDVRCDDSLWLLQLANLSSTEALLMG